MVFSITNFVATNVSHQRGVLTHASPKITDVVFSLSFCPSLKHSQKHSPAEVLNHLPGELKLSKIITILHPSIAFISP